VFRGCGLSVDFPFPLEVRHYPHRKPVCRPLCLAPSLRISRTGRSCLLPVQRYETYRAGAFRASRRSSDLVVRQQPQWIVQPFSTPPLPAEPGSSPGPHPMSPDLLFYPVSDPSEAATRIADLKVVHRRTRDFQRCVIKTWAQPADASALDAGCDIGRLFGARVAAPVVADAQSSPYIIALKSCAKVPRVDREQCLWTACCHGLTNRRFVISARS
jgi:hypothetical protein